MSVYTFKKAKLHWNYFLALESDLAKMTRYIEFCEENLPVYSIELAHLLFAAASEVDVIAKTVCKRLCPTARCENINDYRDVLNCQAKLPQGLNLVSSITISIPRYGLKFAPWENWKANRNPDWWRSYNNVKHQRDEHFQEATLKNALNALGALFILTVYHYGLSFRHAFNDAIALQYATRVLRPEPQLLQLPKSFYDSERWSDTQAENFEALWDNHNRVRGRS